ncbi:transglutaminase domain-containing protein [Roseiconus nitratireducens]|uniref:Transglutaminase domain-containing protein n=1 Tax=Roseiconus nitratireducens TaxID=2605748 RepID=A0A5M6DL97_9BACT|nr:transglutaminase domain-containing protein [Roseiconus nitratireducens]KAA5547176.1 transglutaminase domain-containing protein [Roseiconus nitratireducens]
MSLADTGVPTGQDDRAFDPTVAPEPDAPVRRRLEFQFALLSAAGGLVLSSGQGTEGIAVLAVFAAVFGFVFVDWLRWFELPPVGAYLAMGGAAAYCVRDFWGLQQRGEPQMVSVALLLVLVQAVLMMQRKSRRILEQLAVFCLLELVVAAIFNDAISFGLLMIPIGLVGACALSLLGFVATLESLEVRVASRTSPTAESRWGRLLHLLIGYPDETQAASSFVSTATPASVRSIRRSATAWSRYALLTLSPAVFLIAAAFFYVLPRKVDAERSVGGGAPLVGFDDEVRLQQLGQVMQNPKRALKIELTDQTTDRPYRLNGSLYLRGKVLERYSVDFSRSRPVSMWTSADDSTSVSRRLPERYLPRSGDAATLYDRVDVKVTCEAMSRPALFAIAPYYVSGDATDVVHNVEQGTLSREYTTPPYPRIAYRFGTNAFYQGVQTGWIAEPSAIEGSLSSSGFDLARVFWEQSLVPRYRRELLQYDASLVPTAAAMADRIVKQLPPDERTEAGIARAMETFLANDANFTYTLNLDSSPVPGVDPIEQFLATDRRGHCQYFASSLAMMLRSVQIPCRVVVGYRTEEYNQIGEYYVARQLHAHSWVEALIDADQMPGRLVVPGQPKTRHYWMRLDPTPGASLVEDRADGRAGGIVGLANNLWEDYVVEMDAERQSDELAEAAGLRRVSSSYKSLFQTIEQKLASLRAGNLGGGELSLRRRVPLRWLFAGIVSLAILLLLLKARWPGWFRFSRSRRGHTAIQEPGERFYAETLRQLRRVGIERHSDETPRELLQRVGTQFTRLLPGLRVLTEGFEGVRYGAGDRGVPNRLESALDELTTAINTTLEESSPGPAGR